MVESGDAPLIDLNDATVKKLLAKAKRRGFLTYDELNAALPQDQMSSEQIEDVMSAINDMGVQIVENDEAGEDGDVGDVERPRIVDAEAGHVDEVGDCSIGEAVDQVADCAAGRDAESDGDHRTAAPQGGGEKDKGDRSRKPDQEPAAEVCVGGHEAEIDARIPRHAEVEEWHDVDGFHLAQVHLLDHQPFGELVERHGATTEIVVAPLPFPDHGDPTPDPTARRSPVIVTSAPNTLLSHSEVICSGVIGARP